MMKATQPAPGAKNAYRIKIHNELLARIIGHFFMAFTLLCLAVTACIFSTTIVLHFCHFEASNNDGTIKSNFCLESPIVSDFHDKNKMFMEKAWNYVNLSYLAIVVLMVLIIPQMFGALDLLGSTLRSNTLSRRFDLVRSHQRIQSFLLFVEMVACTARNLIHIVYPTMHKDSDGLIMFLFVLLILARLACFLAVEKYAKSLAAAIVKKRVAFYRDIMSKLKKQQELSVYSVGKEKEEKIEKAPLKN